MYDSILIVDLSLMTDNNLPLTVTNELAISTPWLLTTSQLYRPVSDGRANVTSRSTD